MLEKFNSSKGEIIAVRDWQFEREDYSDIRKVNGEKEFQPELGDEYNETLKLLDNGWRVCSRVIGVPKNPKEKGVGE
jgi:hypothetical protein